MIMAWPLNSRSASYELRVIPELRIPRYAQLAMDIYINAHVHAHGVHMTQQHPRSAFAHAHMKCTPDQPIPTKAAIAGRLALATCKANAHEYTPWPAPRSRSRRGIASLVAADEKAHLPWSRSESEPSLSRRRRARRRPSKQRQGAHRDLGLRNSNRAPRVWPSGEFDRRTCTGHAAA